MYTVGPDRRSSPGGLLMINVVVIVDVLTHSVFIKYYRTHNLFVCRRALSVETLYYCSIHTLPGDQKKALNREEEGTGIHKDEEEKCEGIRGVYPTEEAE